MSLLSRFRRPRAPEIWRGVYERFEDVPASGKGFGASGWIDGLVQELEIVRRGEWSEQWVVEHEVLLLLIRTQSIHVVDFGGAFGATLEYLRCIQPALQIRYDIIEIAPVVERGPSLQPAATFAASLDERHRRPDIVFVKSALQYVADYRSMIRALFELDAQHVLFEKFSGVDCETYASAQVNMDGSAVPCWFISTAEVVEIAGECGYDVALRRRLLREYDQSAFEPRQRMGNARTLLFEKRK
jgi:putative methyltransferase (TIGR04325 family)